MQCSAVQCRAVELACNLTAPPHPVYGSWYHRTWLGIAGLYGAVWQLLLPKPPRLRTVGPIPPSGGAPPAAKKLPTAAADEEEAERFSWRLALTKPVLACVGRWVVVTPSLASFVSAPFCSCA